MKSILSTIGYSAFGAAAIYALYPAPGFSLSIENWRASGSYKIFRNYKIFYRDEEGQGETGTVLLISGVAQSTYDWRKIWDGLLKSNRRVVAVDMLGCGFSDKPQFPTYDLALHADLYEFMMHELGIRDVHILSCDMGNNVASELVARYEDRVTGKANSDGPKLNLKSLCVLNGRIFTGDTKIMPIEKLLMAPYVGAFICRYIYGFSMFSDTISELYGPNKPTKSDLHGSWAIFRFNHGNAVTNKFCYYALDRINKAERLTTAIQRTKIPRHFIYGNRDPHVAEDIINAWKQHVSEDSLTEIDGIGHFPHLEKPQVVVEKYKYFRESIKQLFPGPNLSQGRRNEPAPPSGNDAKKPAKL